jgi:hypothetical protein
MQPEEIIQQKEWRDLTDAERALLKPIAATEGEYNILKKMFILVQEEAHDVPAVNPVLQQRLQGAVKKNKHKSPWLYVAAAAAVVAIVTTLFLLPAKKPGEVIAKAPDTPSIQKNKPDSVKKNKINLPEAPKKQNEIAVIKKDKPVKKIPPVQKDPVIDQVPPPVTNTAVLNISTLIKKDTALLAFITEVY